MEQLIITRHATLVEFLKREGLVNSDVKHIAHATKEDVKGKHVFGILPLWLACHAEKMTEVQLRLPAEKRGSELTVDEIEFYYVNPKTYVIREVKE